VISLNEITLASANPQPIGSGCTNCSLSSQRSIAKTKAQNNYIANSQHSKTKNLANL